MRRIGSVILIGILATVLPGCGSSSSAKVNATTVGGQLKDLEDARDSGLLTEAEYQKQRKEILK